MYYITYKNVLKTGKKYEDFAEWLRKYWPMQKNWGARSVQFWHNIHQEKNTIFCCYKVQNLEKWNHENIQPEAESAIVALGQIVDINQMSMKIGLSPVPVYNEYSVYN